MLAMHMANELLTPWVAAAFLVVAGCVLALAARATQSLDPARIPLMGVLGAFVFSAQMINFPILPGTSGHLVGSVLLAILVGPHATVLVMTSILIVQCLIFQDGGILALGANILNMGIIPCYLGYPLFRWLAGCSPNSSRLFIAIFAATLVGITTGAAMVPVEVRLSGVLMVPFTTFLLLMLGLHLLVGVVEAFITFGAVAYLARVRPALLAVNGFELSSTPGRLSTATVAGSILVAALLLGGVGSLFASKLPDALDSLTGRNAQRQIVSNNEAPSITEATHLQEKTAPLPEYGVRGHDAWWSTSLAGVLGTLITLGVIWAIGRFLHKTESQNPKTEIHSHASG